MSNVIWVSLAVILFCIPAIAILAIVHLKGKRDAKEGAKKTPPEAATVAAATATAPVAPTPATATKTKLEKVKSGSFTAMMLFGKIALALVVLSAIGLVAMIVLPYVNNYQRFQIEQSVRKHSPTWSLTWVNPGQDINVVGSNSGQRLKVNMFENTDKLMHFAVHYQSNRQKQISEFIWRKSDVPEYGRWYQNNPPMEGRFKLEMTSEGDYIGSHTIDSDPSLAGVEFPTRLYKN